ncbi:Alpha/Beta hydrolase protein [Mycena rosella]|uniref:Carboxylic ester hydrolase n=1 Tax=Mycena rosella TaxID=1033263 RepID=A0AAD7DJ57_MYCRO|nr:Alpha/Beta hydrolase protein [Mycena rosella]
MLLRQSIFSLLTAVLCARAQTAPIIDLGYARYQGAVDTAKNITNFLGIRYAAAPLGDLRFRAPQPPANVTGVQQATTEPNECFQATSGQSATNPLRSRADEIIDTEDCLFLNVHYPSNAAGTPVGNLPTIVWIHGGGYLAGSASAFNGEDLIRQSNRGIVAVIIQYRLGVFGFLPGAEVKKNGALNAGLRKFSAISKFGGDPSKVTIWGESAGAGSVLQHVVANNGQTEPQLFRAAITSSTFLPSQYQFNDRIPEVGCTAASDAMACLRAADAATLETANTNINLAGFFGTFLLVPVIDGTFITQRPTLSLLEGKVNGKTLLSFTNTFEGTIFVNQSITSTAAQYAFDLFPNFGQAQANEVEALYSGLGTSIFQDNAVQGESIFICPTYTLLRAFPGRAFKGEFAIPPGLHGNDIVYYFPGTATPPFNNTVFINAFAQSFTSFAISLDPNWSLFDVGNTEMLFNETAAGAPDVRPITTSNALLERCRFWESVAALTAQ